MNVRKRWAMNIIYLTIIVSGLLIGVNSSGAAPLRSQGNPTGVLRGADTAILSVLTDVPATCRYSTTPGIAYDAMPSAFAETGGLYHSQIIYNVASDKSYSRCIRCMDLSGSANTDDYVVNFSVISDTAPDVLSDINVSSVAGTINDGELLSIQGSGFMERGK